MPLLRGSSKATMKANFHELRHGKTYAHTAGKFGKDDARRQMIAIVMSEAGKSKKDSRKRKFY